MNASSLIQERLEEFFSLQKKKYSDRGELALQLLQILEEVTLSKERAGFVYGNELLRVYCGHGGEVSNVVAAAASFELFTTFLAVHDSVIHEEGDGVLASIHDDLPKRIQVFRKQHVAESLAIILGDMCLSLTYELLNASEEAPERVVEASRVLGELIQQVNLVTYGEVVGGEGTSGANKKDLLEKEGPRRIAEALAGA